MIKAAYDLGFESGAKNLNYHFPITLIMLFPCITVAIPGDIIYSSKKDLKIIDYTIDFDRRKSGKSKMDIKILFY